MKTLVLNQITIQTLIIIIIMYNNNHNNNNKILIS